MKRPNILQWLYACLLVRAAVTEMNFSVRERFFAELRPLLADGVVVYGGGTSRFAWPQGWLRIRPVDVRRAIAAVHFKAGDRT